MDELTASANPFAIVVRAHLAMLATRRDDEARYVSKLTLMRELSASGFSRPEGAWVLRFLDWIMRVSPERQIAFSQEVAKEKEAGRMPYMMDIERQRLAEGARGILANWIEDKYGRAGANAAAAVRLLSDDTAINRIAATVQANAPLAEVETLLAEAPPAAPRA